MSDSRNNEVAMAAARSAVAQAKLRLLSWAEAHDARQQAAHSRIGSELLRTGMECAVEMVLRRLTSTPKTTEKRRSWLVSLSSSLLSSILGKSKT